MRTITVVDEDPPWPAAFETLRASVWPLVSDLAVTIEHVGSASVPGLAAKPVIDLDVVVRSGEDVPTAIEFLATLGYAHLGDLGIDGREGLASPPGTPDHNLYVCPPDSLGLANHLALRDHLRRHPERAAEGGALKRRIERANLRWEETRAHRGGLGRRPGSSREFDRGLRAIGMAALADAARGFMAARPPPPRSLRPGSSPGAP